MRYQTINKFRKTHRFLGIFIGIQFLFWTLSGLYFSWTNLDEIHGDQYRKTQEKVVFNTLIALDSLEDKVNLSIESLELKTIGKDPFYWINDDDLYDATTGNKLDLISEKNALEVIQHNILDQYVVEKIERIDSVSEHDEYRGSPLTSI